MCQPQDYITNVSGKRAVREEESKVYSIAVFTAAQNNANWKNSLASTNAPTHNESGIGLNWAPNGAQPMPWPFASKRLLSTWATVSLVPSYIPVQRYVTATFIPV